MHLFRKNELNIFSIKSTVFVLFRFFYTARLLAL